MKFYVTLFYILFALCLNVSGQCDSVVVESGNSFGSGSGASQFYRISHFNSDGVLKSYLGYSMPDGATQYTLGYKTENIFDVNNNLIQENDYSFSNGTPQNVRQVLYTYNASNKLVARVYQSWMNGAWFVSSVDSMYYNFQNVLVDSLHISGNSGNRYLYTYDLTGKDSIEIVQTLILPSQWENDNRSDFYYNAFDQKILSVRFDWNVSTWDSLSRTRYIYQGNLIDSAITQTLATNWQDQYLTYYEYSPFNQPIYVYGQYWVDTAWIYSTRETNEVDVNGYPSFSSNMYAYYQPDGTYSWGDYTGYTYYTYSPDGNLLDETGRLPAGGPFHNTYTYSGNILINGHYYSETMGGFSSQSDVTYIYTDIHGSNTICTGGSTVLSVDSCIGNSYLWSTGETTASILVSAPGNYSVTTILANGFSTTSLPFSVSVQSSVPYVPATSDSAKFVCSANALQLQIPALPNVIYQWYRNDSLLANQTYTSLLLLGTNIISGDYYVIGSNACGNDTSSTTSVSVVPSPASPVINASGALSFCAGDSVVLSTASANSYLWNPGAATGQAVTVKNSGNYTVRITDANGCMSTSTSLYISAFSFPQQIHLSLNNYNLIADYNGVFDQWFVNGDTIPLATGSTCTPQIAGYYYFASANNYPCITYSDSIYIDPNSVNVDAGPDAYACLNGSVSVGLFHPVFGGTPPYTYSWSPTGHVNNYSNGTGLVYNVTQDEKFYLTVTDANGISATDSMYVYLHIPQQPQLIHPGLPMICSAGSTQIQIDNSGAPFTIDYWFRNSDTLATTNTYFSTNIPGIFQAQITDQYGCSILTEIDTVIMAPYSSQPVINGILDTNVCLSGMGTIWVHENFGDTYNWRKANQWISSDTLIEVTYPELYTITETDTNGCARSSSIEFDVTNSLITFDIAASTYHQYCLNDTITLYAAVLDGWTYSWEQDGMNMNLDTSVITITEEGLYTCTAISPQGCTAVGEYTVYSNSFPPSITLSQQGQVLSVPEINYVGYQWYFNGQVIPYAFDNHITPTQAGIYMVRIYNSYGCETFSNSINFSACGVVIPDSPLLVCSGACTGELLANAYGQGTISYQWSNGQNTPIINGLCDGTYYCTITDSLGCIAGDSALISTDSISISSTFNSASCSTCSDGSIDFMVQGGIPAFLYTLNPVAGSLSGNSFVNLLPGLYEVCVTDIMGCSACTSDSLYTGVNTILEEIAGYSIYPNPVKNDFYINGLNLSSEFVELNIFTSDGKKIRTCNKQKESYHVENLSAGSYLVQIIEKNEVRYLQFVKQ